MLLIFFGENQSLITSNVLFRPGVQRSYGTLGEKVTVHSIHVRSHFESTGSNVSISLIRPPSFGTCTEFPLLRLHSKIISASVTNIQDWILVVQAVDSLDLNFLVEPRLGSFLVFLPLDQLAVWILGDQSSYELVFAQSCISVEIHPPYDLQNILALR